MEEFGIESVFPYVPGGTEESRHQYTVLEATRVDVATNRKISRLAARLITNADEVGKKGRWDKLVIGTTLAGLATAAIWGAAYVTTTQENEQRAARTEAELTVLHDPAALGKLGLCETELLAESQVLARTHANTNKNIRLVSSDYTEAAKLAAAHEVPCVVPGTPTYSRNIHTINYTFEPGDFVHPPSTIVPHQ